MNLNRQWAHAHESNEANYLDLCRMYAKNNKVFSTFRRKGLAGILEGGAKEIGNYSLERIASLGRLPQLHKCINKAKKNDAVGSPFIHRFKGIPPCSSSTLQYLDNAFDILNLTNNKKIKRITEIGGGVWRSLQNFK